MHCCFFYNREGKTTRVNSVGERKPAESQWTAGSSLSFHCPRLFYFDHGTTSAHGEGGGFDGEIAALLKIKKKNPLWAPANEQAKRQGYLRATEMFIIRRAQTLCSTQPRAAGSRGCVLSMWVQWSTTLVRKIQFLFSRGNFNKLVILKKRKRTVEAEGETSNFYYDLRKQHTE